MLRSTRCCWVEVLLGVTVCGVAAVPTQPTPGIVRLPISVKNGAEDFVFGPQVC